MLKGQQRNAGVTGPQFSDTEFHADACRDAVHSSRDHVALFDHSYSHDGGSQAWQYGPTITKQMNVVTEMLKFDPFSELQQMLPTYEDFRMRPRNTVMIQCTTDDPADAHIELKSLGLRTDDGNDRTTVTLKPQYAVSPGPRI